MYVTSLLNEPDEVNMVEFQGNIDAARDKGRQLGAGYGQLQRPALGDCV